MTIRFSIRGMMLGAAKELVRTKGMTPEEASEKTGVPVAEILREYEEPAVKLTTVAPDGTVKEHRFEGKRKPRKSGA